MDPVTPDSGDLGLPAGLEHRSESKIADEAGRRLRLARELIAIGRPAEAHDLIRAVLRTEPAGVDPLCTLAYYHAAAEDHAAALAAADAAVAAAPDVGLAHHHRARALIGLGRAAEASAAAECMVRLEPANPVAHELLAEALERAGRRADAVRAAHRALRLDPAAAPTHAVLARICAQTGDRAGLLAAARAGQRLDPQADWPVAALADAHAQRWRYRAAARAYQALVRAHPTDRRWGDAFRGTLAMQQLAWAALAAVPALVALGLYLARVPPGPRAAAAAALIGGWLAGYVGATRGLRPAWWRLVRGRGGRDRRMPAIGSAVLLGFTGLFGFVPGRLPWQLLVLVAPFFVLGLWLLVGFGQIELAAYRRRRQQRRAFRSEATRPAAGHHPTATPAATPASSPGSSAPPPPPAHPRPHGTPAPPAE